MSKFKRPSLDGLVKAPTQHNSVSEHSHNHVITQLRDDEVPDAVSVALSTPPEPAQEPKTAPASTKARGRGNVKSKSVADENAGMAHRSLYAKPETLDLIREIAFKERISAQSLYREGLLLMLQGRGHLKGKTVDDV